MKKLLKFAAAGSIAIFFSACTYDVVPPEVIDPIPSNVSYKTDVMPIWKDCTGCHNGSLSPDMRDANSYSSLVPAYVIAFDADNSELMQHLLGTNGKSQMPPSGKLPTNKTNIVKGWIDQGAKNN